MGWPTMGWRDADDMDVAEFGLDRTCHWQIFSFAWGRVGVVLCARQVFYR